VLGREPLSYWADVERALLVVKGEAAPADEREALEWVCNPLPPGGEVPLFMNLRLQLGIPDDRFFTDRGFGSLSYLDQQTLSEVTRPDFLREHNPVVRHTVLRRRCTLEDAGLIQRVAVNVHPDADAPPGTYHGVNFQGLGLLTNHPFDLAYRAAEEFTEALGRRVRGAGCMALTAHLLQLRGRARHSRADAPARGPGRRGGVGPAGRSAERAD